MQNLHRDTPIFSDRRAPRPSLPSNRREYFLLAVAGAAVLAITLYAWWDWRVAPVPVSAPMPVATQAAPAPTPASAVPAIQYPIGPAPAELAAPLPTLEQSDRDLLRQAESMLGRQAMALLRTTGLVRNLVATVDNLPRSHAPTQVWPVHPTSGRFSVLAPAEQGSTGPVEIDPDNEMRYVPFVLMVESVDPQKAVALYRWAYPLFQQAYEELGFPGRYFNDRLVAVIDHLLAAPEPAQPVLVRQIRVEGPKPLERPWVHYVYADPQLEALSAGQKLMVRVGPVHERRLKAQLRKFRDALTH